MLLFAAYLGAVRQSVNLLLSLFRLTLSLARKKCYLFSGSGKLKFSTFVQMKVKFVNFLEHLY